MARGLFIIALTLLIAVGGVGAVVASESAVASPPTLAAEIQRLVVDGTLPGAIAHLELDGVEIESAVVGWQDRGAALPLAEDAIFRLYSMSKPITSVAVMMLAEQGRLSLDDPVAKYLPELANVRVYVSGGLADMVTRPAQNPITIRHLLLHTSGIAYHFTGDSTVHRYYRRHGVMRDTPVGRQPGDGAPARSLDELVQRIGAAPLLHEPGSQFHYSYSTTVLGAVIERVSGQRLGDALREMLLDPLGMQDTAFVIGDDRLARFTTLYEAVPGGITAIERPEESEYRDRTRLLDGGGALVSTAGDYLRFARMLVHGGQLDGRRYLSEASVDEMFEPHVTIGGGSSGGVGFGYGFLLGSENSESQGRQPAGTVGWSGSGNTFFFLDPERGLIGLFMTHVLTPGEFAERATELRRIMTRAAMRATQGLGGASSST